MGVMSNIGSWVVKEAKATGAAWNGLASSVGSNSARAIGDAGVGMVGSGLIKGSDNAMIQRGAGVIDDLANGAKYRKMVDKRMKDLGTGGEVSMRDTIGAHLGATYDAMGGAAGTTRVAATGLAGAAILGSGRNTDNRGSILPSSMFRGLGVDIAGIPLI